MPASKLKIFKPFLTSKQIAHIAIQIITKDQYKSWIDEQDEALRAHAQEKGFKGDTGQILILRSEEGMTLGLIAGCSSDTSIKDGSKIHDTVRDYFSKEILQKLSFSFEADDLTEEQMNRLHIGWGLGMYSFNLYKEAKDEKTAGLVISSKANKKRVKSFVESICIIRDLVNIPANDMGPDELEEATKYIAKLHKLKVTTIKDEALKKKKFPMIYDVGKGSSRRPRLIDFKWGDDANPHVTLVGKGVCFDTGGLDIKPSQFMLTMKKDMGGAAHVLALAHLIMSLNLPIRLRVLIPAVENSISGDAYRPSDILESRKGITVEVGNTDAEGRLVLADAMTHACEDTPDLLIDFATLTGAARIALGYDIPALFSNDDDTAYSIQKLSAATHVEDPVWHLPLWEPYRKDLDSPVADISSTGTGKAGATNAALFLKEFIDENIEWIHMDVFAWEQNGKPGRPKGGADTGMRAIFAFLEDRYVRRKDD